MSHEDTDWESASKEEIEAELENLQEQMNQPDFWSDKESAKEVVAQYERLKELRDGVGEYDKRSATVSIYAGAGGQDAEDFAAMLFEMYIKYAQNHGYKPALVHEHKTDHGGFRNVTFDISGKGVYGELKHESGVHRLVRISPFNSAKQRHTSFALVEVVPEMKGVGDIELDEGELEVSFSKSGGPGGQNVNKRETAVRIVHQPTGLSVHVDSERTQKRNREKALEILRGKLYHKKKQAQEEKQQAVSLTAGAENEWGNQIRSYVLHPYKMVKDHRTNVEVRDVDSVLEGELSAFIKVQNNELS